MVQGLRNDFTARLIHDHIRPGMRVMDAGCGDGEITILLADAAGDNGEVDGIDINQSAIQAAQKRAQQAGRRNVRFYAADISAPESGQYDAVFGRRILMYQQDAAAEIRKMKRLLKPGGIMLFQESDENGTLLNGEDLSLHNKVQSWIWKTVKYEGGDTHIGSRLYGMMRAADMNIIDYCAEAVLQTPETGSDLAWVVSVMQARMKAAGIHPEMNHLEERLNDELKLSNHAFVRDLAYGICAEKNG